MKENSTKNFLEVVPDFKDNNPLPMVDVSSNVLSLAKTVTSSAIDLCRLKLQSEENHMKTQLLFDYNEKTFATANKEIDEHYASKKDAMNCSRMIIEYGLAEHDTQAMFRGLDAVVKICTQNHLLKIPEFAKQLDMGEKLQLGYDNEEDEND